MDLEKLNASVKSKCEALLGVLDRIDGEKAPTGDQLKSWNDERVGLTGEIDALNAQIKTLEENGKAREAAKAHLERLGQPLNPMVHGLGAPGAKSVKSAGAQFTSSEAYTSWMKHNAPGGRVPDASAGGRLPQSGAAEIGGFKSLIIGSSGFAAPADTSANAFVRPEHRGLVDMGPFMRPLRIVDLITVEPTAADIIFFARGTSVIAAAAITAEGTVSTINNADGRKPEGTMTFEVAEAIVRTIPVWTAVTRQALADADRLASIIDQELRYDVQKALEDQIVRGDGTGINFKGLEHLGNALSQAYSVSPLQTARKARTNLLLNGRVMPSAWVMHPSDWETFDLAQDAEQRYYFGGPIGMGTPTLWGIPVVESEAKTQGEAMLGAFGYAHLADREQTTVRVSDQHADYFTRNLMAVLAEMRAAFYVVREQAFCKAALA